jgi:hypothetical protein
VALPEQDLGLLDLLGVRPPYSRSGSHTTISSSGMPLLKPVQRPRCWSGKNSTFSRWAKAQSRMVGALVEVHTMPPCSPQKALRSAAELM